MGGGRRNSRAGADHGAGGNAGDDGGKGGMAESGAIAQQQSQPGGVVLRSVLREQLGTEEGQSDDVEVVELVPRRKWQKRTQDQRFADIEKQIGDYPDCATIASEVAQAWIEQGIVEIMRE